MSFSGKGSPLRLLQCFQEKLLEGIWPVPEETSALAIRFSPGPRTKPFVRSHTSVPGLILGLSLPPVWLSEYPAHWAWLFPGC